jgi:hypothetical protein
VLEGPVGAPVDEQRVDLDGSLGSRASRPQPSTGRSAGRRVKRMRWPPGRRRGIAIGTTAPRASSQLRMRAAVETDPVNPLARGVWSYFSCPIRVVGSQGLNRLEQSGLPFRPARTLGRRDGSSGVLFHRYSVERATLDGLRRPLGSGHRTMARCQRAAASRLPAASIFGLWAERRRCATLAIRIIARVGHEPT